MSAGYNYNYEIEQDRRREIYLNKITKKTNEFLNRYEDILNSIEAQNLVIYVTYEFNDLKRELNDAQYKLHSDPEEAMHISRNIGKYIGILPKKAKELRKKSNALEKKRRIENEQKEKERQKRLEEIRKDFSNLIDEQFLVLDDPIIRDYAIDDIFALTEKMRDYTITENNFTTKKNELTEKMTIIMNKATIKADEYKKKYLKDIEQNIEKEILLEQVAVEKKNIQNIKTDNPDKLKELMNGLLSVEKNIQNNTLTQAIDKQLADISDEINEEEANEEYRRYTVKSIYAILNKLNFRPSNPKVIDNDVILTAEKINGHKFEAIIKKDGSMTSHFNGYEYQACKNDIEELEVQLASCYGVELKKTNTIWENPDRIQKNAKPISKLKRKG